MSSAWASLSAHLSRGALLLSVLGLSLGALLKIRLGRAFDRRTFRAINRPRPRPALDWLMWSMTHLGSAWAGLGGMAFALRLQRRSFGILFAAAILTQALIVGVCKTLIQRRRPFLQMHNVRVIGLKPADLSYPSGHSALAFSMATLLAFGLPLALPARIVVYVLAAGVAYSRVYLGVHYPLDVLSGATFGTGWGLLWVSLLSP